MEAAYNIFNTTPTTAVSAQQFVDCTMRYGNLGCKSGYVGYTWNYLLHGNSAMSAADYPYNAGTSGDPGPCFYDKSKGQMNLASASTVGTTTADITAAIYQQPVTMMIAANSVYFQTYHAGILTSDKLCGTDTNQNVVAVGYGENTEWGNYYIVRNTWGKYWGDAGHVGIAQGDYPGICGTNTLV